jgi:hypothetical protein
MITYARSVEVAGTSYRLRDVNAYLARHLDCKLHLEYEPTNKYDINAIKIIAEDLTDGTLRHIGYVPAHLAPRIRRDIDDKLDELHILLMFHKNDFKRPILTFDIIIPDAAKAESTPE